MADEKKDDVLGDLGKLYDKSKDLVKKAEPLKDLAEGKKDKS